MAKSFGQILDRLVKCLLRLFEIDDPLVTVNFRESSFGEVADEPISDSRVPQFILSHGIARHARQNFEIPGSKL